MKQRSHAPKVKKPPTIAGACTMFHSWVATFVQGQFLCTRCGIYASCPGCTPVNPHQYDHIHYCVKHQAPKGADL